MRRELRIDRERTCKLFVSRPYTRSTLDRIEEGEVAGKFDEDAGTVTLIELTLL
jgi:hypothetical protein